MSEGWRRARYAGSAESSRTRWFLFTVWSLFTASTVVVLAVLTNPGCSSWPGVGKGGSPTPEGQGEGVAYSKIDFWNCNKFQEGIASGPHRPVTIYLHDANASPWQLPDPGPQTLQAQYNSGGSCPYDDSGTPLKEFELYLAPPGSSGTHQIEVIIVDPGLTGCGADDPTNPNCLLEHFLVPGNSASDLIFKRIISGDYPN